MLNILQTGSVGQSSSVHTVQHCRLQYGKAPGTVRLYCTSAVQVPVPLLYVCSVRTGRYVTQYYRHHKHHEKKIVVDVVFLLLQSFDIRR